MAGIQEGKCKYYKADGINRRDNTLGNSHRAATINEEQSFIEHLGVSVVPF
jgi:hypothetical protein